MSSKISESQKLPGHRIFQTMSSVVKYPHNKSKCLIFNAKNFTTYAAGLMAAEWRLSWN